MGADWSSKLYDMVLDGLPAARKLIPRHIQKDVLARLNDFNPFASIASNDDLLRALRLAWVEAALKINKAVQAAASTPEWKPQSKEILGFDSALVGKLRELRSKALHRETHPGNAPMDQHLQELIANSPSSLMSHDLDPGRKVTQAFCKVIAALVNCSESDIPAIYSRLAEAGLPIPNSSDRHRFGDLVYLEFAELLRNPTAYPEARHSYLIGLAGVGVQLGKQCLAQLQGYDEKIDRVIEALNEFSTDGGLTCWLERLNDNWTARWKVLGVQMATVDAKLDLNTAKLTEMSEQVRLLVHKMQEDGLVGNESGQLAYNMVLALAQTLRPDDGFDLEGAYRELEAAVSVAVELIAEGHSTYYQDRFIEEVLASVRQSIEAGLLEKGTESFDHALAELDLREAREREASQRRKTQVLEHAVKHAMLTRNPQRVADFEEQLAAIHHPKRPAMSNFLKKRINAYFNEGHERGLRLPIQVSIELARRRLKQSKRKVKRVESNFLLGRSLAVIGARESTLDCLLEARGVFIAGLQDCTLGKTPLEWALLQNALGNALQKIGERVTDSAWLTQAIEAYQEALLGFTRDRDQSQWSMVQNNLGNVLRILGMREGNTTLLKQSAEALRLALSEQPHDGAPLERAITQNNLGIVLHDLGRNANCKEQLLQAIELFQMSLKELTYERAEIDWATTNNNLASVFVTLGQLENGGDWLLKAVQIHKEALTIISQPHTPLIWALMQNNLGNVLKILGEREKTVDQFQEASECYQRALLERTQERVPLEWAQTQNNLGVIYLKLGEREKSTERLELSILAFKKALLERTRECAPLDWASTKDNLGCALRALGVLNGSLAMLKEAEQAHMDALLERHRERVPAQWAMTQNNLAVSLMSLGRFTDDIACLRQSEHAYKLALEEQTHERAPLSRANLQKNLGILYQILAEYENVVDNLKQAVQAFKAALPGLSQYQKELTHQRLMDTQDYLVELLDERA